MKNKLQSISHLINYAEYDPVAKLLKIEIREKIDNTIELEAFLRSSLPFIFNVEILISKDLYNEDLNKLRENSKDKFYDNFSNAKSKNLRNKGGTLRKRKNFEGDGDVSIYNHIIKITPIKIRDLALDTLSSIEAQIISCEYRELKNGKKLMILGVSDYDEGVTIKRFLEIDEYNHLVKHIKEGKFYKFEGKYKTSEYNGITDKFFEITAINNIEQPKIEKITAGIPRCELHSHTNFSAGDSVAFYKKLIDKAQALGLDAITITDSATVQSFPDAYSYAKGKNIKLQYGLEAEVFDDVFNRYYGNKTILDKHLVIFDIETTGFSARNHKIIEIGAVRLLNGEIKDKFNIFINPNEKLTQQTIELTNIKQSDVDAGFSLHDGLMEFSKFCGDSVVVAHNAEFDMSFIRYHFAKEKLEFNNIYIDSIDVAKAVMPDRKQFGLKGLAKHFKIEQISHHRASDDSLVTARIMQILLEKLKAESVITMEDLGNKIKSTGHQNARSFPVTIISKNQESIFFLYKMLSSMLLEYNSGFPKLPLSLLLENKQYFFLGSSCKNGIIFQKIQYVNPETEIEKYIDIFDFIEIMPASNFEFFLREGWFSSLDDIRKLNEEIVCLADKKGKMVCATGDVHLVNKEDEIYRTILLTEKKHDAKHGGSVCHLRSTEEMLEEFAYFGERAEEFVLLNPAIISSTIEKILPVPEETAPPIIEGSDEELRNSSWEKVKSIYGDNVPELVKNRLERELNSIISNGYSVMYIIARKLVMESERNGYTVGSRGSVGSSFAATMSNISEINPLPPHYLCPKCKNSEFILDGSYDIGYDLPNKICPQCGTPYNKEGFNIPFETFLGFDGDKEPDIDLNFSGEYQSEAHKYCEVLFQKGNTFKAGTVQTIQDKRAELFVTKYYELNGLPIPHKAEVMRLGKGLLEVKLSDGSHPGGIMVLPKNRQIYEFTPIQYAKGDDGDEVVVTTHFHYKALSGKLLKLDILGHLGPSLIRALHDFTGVDPLSVNIGDPKILDIFSGIDSLDVKDKGYKASVGTLGIPEFGTNFVMNMLIETRPKTVGDLVRISGLSHGTDVWTNNAQELVRNKVVELKDVIATRDGIMTYLILKNVEPLTAFKLMENIRKGKGLKPEEEDLLRKHDVPDWYINSANIIKYMFPKAHAAAYVVMSLRIAYFKVYYPLAFYAARFTYWIKSYNSLVMVQGKEAVLEEIERQRAIGNNKTAKDIIDVCNLMLEFYARGLEILPVSIKDSDATMFLIKDSKLLPPIASLKGIGESVATSIVSKRLENPDFISIDDCKQKLGITESVAKILEEAGAFGDLPESNQISFFDIF